jgi:ABC-type glycerol-3-phosphate transport system substrate-binding protein
MKRFAFVLGMALLLAACGGGNKPRSPIDGTWHAVGTGGNGMGGFDFTITLTATSNNGLSVTNSTFSGSSLCFLAQPDISGTFNGTTGAFQLTVTGTQSRASEYLNGTLKGNTVTGTWRLSSVYLQCGNDSGTFTMTKQ